MHPSSGLLASVLVAGILAVGARPAAACTCRLDSGPSPCEAFAMSSIVFVGEVMSVREVGGDFHMRLRVVRALKGIEAATADIWSSATSSCGLKLNRGGRYVIYPRVIKGRMSIDFCGYSSALTSGEPDPELPPVPGRVYGRVTRYDDHRIREYKGLLPIPSVRIALDHPAGRVVATSDRWGRFQFTDVPPGNYQLAVDAGRGLAPVMPESVALPHRDACAAAQVVLWPAGKVSGRVQTADGSPAPGIYVRLLPQGPAANTHAEPVHFGERTGPDGRFTFGGVRPGTYVLAINPDAIGGTPLKPYAAAWFGGADRASATRIPLAEGSVIELDRPFVLPALPATARSPLP